MEKALKAHPRTARGGLPGPLIPSASVPRAMRSARGVDEGRMLHARSHQPILQPIIQPPRPPPGVFDFLATVAGNLLGATASESEIKSEVTIEEDHGRSAGGSGHRLPLSPDTLASAAAPGSPDIDKEDALILDHSDSPNGPGDEDSPVAKDEDGGAVPERSVDAGKNEGCSWNKEGVADCDARRDSSAYVLSTFLSQECCREAAVEQSDLTIADGAHKVDTPPIQVASVSMPTAVENVPMGQTDLLCKDKDSPQAAETIPTEKPEPESLCAVVEPMATEEPSPLPLPGSPHEVAEEENIDCGSEPVMQAKEATVEVKGPEDVVMAEEAAEKACPGPDGTGEQSGIAEGHCENDGEKDRVVAQQPVRLVDDTLAKCDGKKGDTGKVDNGVCRLDTSGPGDDHAGKGAVSGEDKNTEEAVKMEVDEGEGPTQGAPPPLIAGEPGKKPKSGIRSKRRRIDADGKDMGEDSEARRTRQRMGRPAGQTPKGGASTSGQSAAEREAQMLMDAELAASLAEAGAFEPPAAAAMRRSVIRMSMTQGQDSPHSSRPSNATTPKSIASTPKSPALLSKAAPNPPPPLVQMPPLTQGHQPAHAAVPPPVAAGTNSVPLKKRPVDEQQVKVLIKSFEVPELTVTLPNSATVASLKKAVTDAATTLLGGGLRVRVMMQGRKVADEAATLAQCGIQRGSRPDSLGFMLEPMPPVGQPTPNSGEDPLLVLSQAINQISPRVVQMMAPSINRKGGRPGRARPLDPNAAGPSSMPSIATGARGRSVGPASPHPTRIAAAEALAAIRKQAEEARRGCPKGDMDMGPEPSPMGAGAIVLHAGVGANPYPDAMALVPLGSKKRPGVSGNELMLPGKRRIRRPFSVTEVEALVCAVEKLGTGRFVPTPAELWRDVKLRAFANAKHRTYVDLKDKWKTLVHTAQIAPHQRRGEPVPQELLERVTKAHQYWTAMQLRQQAEQG